MEKDKQGNRTDIEVPEYNKITEDDDGIVKAAKEKAQKEAAKDEGR